MKRILTLIVTLVCVFAAYSQNSIYIWKDNTLSVQAADSLTIDRSAYGFVDLGLSVMWAKSDASYGCEYSYAETAVNKYGGRLPTKEEYYELAKRCRINNTAGRGYLTFIGSNGNSISLRNTGIGGTANRFHDYEYWIPMSNGYNTFCFTAHFYPEDEVSYEFSHPFSSNSKSLPARAVCSY